MGSQPDGRISRPSSAHIIFRRRISVSAMGIVHNARNSTVASHKRICTIHERRSRTSSVRQWHAIHRSQPQQAHATYSLPLFPALPSMLYPRFDGQSRGSGPSMARLPRPERPQFVTTGCRAFRPPDTSLHLTQRPPSTEKLRMKHSPGQLHHPHSTGLFQWRVTGSPLLYHTDWLVVGIPDLASTLDPAASSSLSDRLHPPKVIRYFHRIPRATR